MPQHFLLSAKARTLSVRRVFEMNEEQAFKTFKEVTCPMCGVIHEHSSLMQAGRCQAHILRVDGHAERLLPIPTQSIKACSFQSIENVRKYIRPFLIKLNTFKINEL